METTEKTKEQLIEELEAKRKREKTQSVNMITAGWYGEATYD